MKALTLLLMGGVAATFAWLAIESPADRFGPQVAGVTVGVWLLATAGRVAWSRAHGAAAPFGPLRLHPLSFFLVLVSAVYTLLALEEGDLQLKPSPDQPDFVPGLFTDLTVYYLAVNAAVVAFIALYGQAPRRLLETAVTVQVVYLSPLYEPVVQMDIGAPLMLGNMLVLSAFALSDGREHGLTGFRWTPFGAPLVAFVIAGLLVTITAAYMQHSLVVWAKITPLVLLALLIMNLVREQRQVWLLWAAIVLPTTAMTVQILYKLGEIGNHMGIEFAVRYRFHFLGLVGANTLGLAIAVDLLLILGALFWTRQTLARAGLAALLVPLVPTLLVLRSSSGLVALVAGLAIILVVSWSRQLLVEARRLVSPASALLAAGIVAAVVALVAIPNPYRSEWRGEVSDPTTGRGVRENVWVWSIENFQHHSVTGIGLADRRFEPRAEHVPEFPFRDVTQLAERRQLLGGSGTHWRIFVWGHPHNILLLVAETMGVVGLAVFAWLLAALGLVGLDLVRKPMTRERWLMTVSIAAVGAGLAWSLFALGQDVAYLPLHTWVLLGVLGAGYCLANQARTGRPLRFGVDPAGIWQRVRPAAVPLATVALFVAFLGMVARPAFAEILAQRAQEQRQQGQFADAVDNLELARRLDPLSADYLEDLAQVRSRHGTPQDELSAVKRLAELQPDSATNHTRLGWIYWMHGELDRAVAQFERAAELDPWNALGSNNLMALGLSYIASGRRAEAIAAFKQAVFVDPGAAAQLAWLPLTRPDGSPDRVLDPAYFSRQEPDSRLQPLLRQQLTGPTQDIPSPPLPPAPIRTLYISEVLESAYADYRTELARDPERALGILSALARANAAAGRHDRAVELLLELREQVAEESYVHYDLGLSYVALGRDAEAEQAFRTALELAEESGSYDIYEPFAHYQLGLVHRRANDHELALEEFRATLDTYRWPYFPEAYQALAEEAMLTGHDDEAKATLRKLSYLLGDEAVRGIGTVSGGQHR